MSKRTQQVIRAEIKALEKEYQEVATKEFREGVQELFAKYGPKLKSFGFWGYTPHFNDGEPCRYRIYHDEPYINGFKPWDDDDEGDGENLYADGENKENDEIIEAVSKFLNSYPDEFYERNWNDGDQVTFTPNGESAEYKDHD